MESLTNMTEYQKKKSDYMQAYIIYWTTHQAPRPDYEEFGIGCYDAANIRYKVQETYDFAVKVVKK